METWSLFTTQDMFIALLGFVGVTSAIIVIVSAFSKTNKREVQLKLSRNYNMSDLEDFDDFCDELLDQMDEAESQGKELKF